MSSARTRQQLEHNFSTHPITDEQAETQSQIRHRAASLALSLAEHCPESRELSLALTNLEPIVAEKTETLPLWVQWKFLWIVFGCLFTEWSIRKYLGLS